MLGWQRSALTRAGAVLGALAVGLGGAVGPAACSSGSGDDGPDAGARARRDDDAAAEAAAAEPVTTGPLSAATEAWWDYDRPADYDRVVTRVDVPVRDGTRLGCSLLRPGHGDTPAGGRFPGLVVELTPYHVQRSGFESEAGYFVERGYDALICDVRGTGDSGGEWQNAMSAQDGRDAHDLVEWLADQPHSDGRIGQFGESYGGQTSYGAAVEHPPHLRAVAPLQPPASLYDDVIYPGGIKTTEDGTVDWWPPIGAALSGGSIDAPAEYATNRDHPTFDAYWEERSFAGRYDDIEVPVLTVGGWEDGFFRAGTLADIEGALDRTWAVYGPWTHLTPIRFPGCGACQPDGLAPGVLLAWFDRWVGELDDVPVPDEPTFVSYEGPAGVGAGWRELSRWDPVGADPLTLVLGGDGTLAPADSGDTAGTDDTGGDAGPVTFHQPGDDSVTFTTAPLDGDQVLLGRPTLTLEATLSGPDANLYAELLDIGPDGTVIVVNDGFLRASHRESHVDPSPVTPDEPTALTVEIRADHHRFAAGHRIGLRLSSGAPDTLVPNATPVDVTLTTAGAASSLTLPHVSGL
jgi:predicted acyl esterase